MIHKFYSKLNDQEKKVFFAATLILSLALLDRLFFGPVFQKLKVVDDEIKSQEISIKRDLRFLSYKEKIKSESKAFDKYFVKKLLEDDVVNAEFLRKVEELASESAVNLVKSNPADPKKQKDSMEYYVSLDCTGTLENMIKFMHLVNTTEDLLKVIKFNMSPQKGTANEVNTSMIISKLIMYPFAVNNATATR